MAVKVREKRGAWWVFVDWKGRRKAKRVGVGKAGKRAAEAAAEHIQAKLALGDLSVFEVPAVAPAVPTLAAFAEQWRKTDLALRLKLSSQETYEQVLRVHIVPVLGATPLTALTRERIKGLIAALVDKGLGTERVQLTLSVLTACLHAAVDAGLLSANPAARLTRYTKKPDAPVREVEIFTPGELDRILETAKAQMPQYYPLVFLMTRTGLRLGEALALQVGDLDFQRRELWVRRSWGTSTRSYGDRRIGTPKNRRLRRVDMSRGLCEVLQGYLGLREADVILAGGRLVGSAWLFPGPERGPMTRNQFQPRWRRLLATAGIRGRKAHTLRHTFASQLIQNGESLAYVRDQLGHHSIKLTVDVYGHLIPGANKAAVDRLDEPQGHGGAVSAPFSKGLDRPVSERGPALPERA